MTDNRGEDIRFSNKDRATRIVQSRESVYDLIIIGGGITGAGIAIDAALRGLSTLLVEKVDFAAGTSSKSTKLIHGGLRYLKQFEFGLVRESGLERAVAHRNIPHLVHPEKMFLPIVKKGSFSKIAASMAVSVYDRLAKVTAADRKETFNRKESIELEPIINKDLIKSGVQYSEYRTDDARLTIELIKAAKRHNAEAFNYMQVNDFVYLDGKVKGVMCTDLITGSQIDFKATQVVSAAGPWVDKLREVNASKEGKSLQLTKGVHIVVPREKVPVQSAVYFDAFDGRMLFAIPRGKVTYVGTSDTVYKEDLNRVLCTTADADYILKAVNNMFEITTLQKEDIISTWAGLRPLIHEDGKSPSELSRKDEIFISDTELISIAGGKLTGYRKMAKRIVDLVQEKNPSFSNKECATESFAIHADGFKDYKAFREYRKSLEKEFYSNGLTAFDAWYLSTTYGRHATKIINDALAEKTDFSKALIKSEIAYCIEFESCYHPIDYFNRRTGKAYFDINSVKDNMELIITEFQSHFGWDDNKTKEHMADSQTAIEDLTILKA